MNIDVLYNDAIELLKQLISTPSFSCDEDKTADLIQSFFKTRNITAHRHLNNVWAVNEKFNPAKPTLLLNSHHDTVKPNPQYTRNPYQPIIEDGKLYGLGSNDAGGCLVSLIATFVHFYNHENLGYNIVIAATAEEEISGRNGIEDLFKMETFQALFNPVSAIPPLGGGGAAIVGEPTQMQLAVAEKGLMVLDCISFGKAGHAAREEGENAIYNAMKDIAWISNYRFDKISDWLGPVKMSVTSIQTENKAHNMVPSQCSFVVDVRVPDNYSHEDILEEIRRNTSCDIKPRSMRMRATRIDVNHPLVQAGIKLGNKPYGSPTSSDKALIPFPTLKCGPGDSARSHTADEFIYLEEIKAGILGYIGLLQRIL